jgi:hypothetical protein
MGFIAFALGGSGNKSHTALVGMVYIQLQCILPISKNEHQAIDKDAVIRSLDNLFRSLMGFSKQHG